MYFRMRFWIDFGSILGYMLDPFLVQSATKTFSKIYAEMDTEKVMNKYANTVENDAKKHVKYVSFGSYV